MGYKVISQQLRHDQLYLNIKGLNSIFKIIFAFC